MGPTSDTPFQLDGPQWSFAVHLYGRPGVANACLLLQDRIGADVSLLLFALFIAQDQRIMLERADLEELDGAIAAWRGEVIRPLRSIRRRLKTGPDPAPDSATELLLQQIKVAEIHAEQIELAALAHHLDRHLHTHTTGTVDIPALLDRLAAFFAEQSGTPRESGSPELRAALETIADAVG